MIKVFEPRALLRQMFDAAIAAAQPAHCIPPHLPAAPKGRTVGDRRRQGFGGDGQGIRAELER